ncbi:MAG: hypothetical protein GOVbin1573_19 [Prokaryotic dsDNA virus sp.]|nr:MAG: hypothetical protein GOVbin1573_19 [Prokaryotic dsDNA virus sp.]
MSRKAPYRVKVFRRDVSQISAKPKETEMDWQVGQSVLVVDAMRPDHPIIREGKIAKIGRKWAYLEPAYLGRFDVTTKEIDAGGYSRTSTVWRSEEEYQASVRLRRRWWRICDAARYPWSPPKHLTSADLDDLERILRVEPQEE